MRVGVGPGVKMEDMRSVKKADMIAKWSTIFRGAFEGSRIYIGASKCSRRSCGCYSLSIVMSQRWRGVGRAAVYLFGYSIAVGYGQRVLRYLFRMYAVAFEGLLRRERCSEFELCFERERESWMLPANLSRSRIVIQMPARFTSSATQLRQCNKVRSIASDLSSYVSRTDKHST